jgi:ABC-type uncharacterized transport system involved in gliding motility auxiliary subunit
MLKRILGLLGWLGVVLVFAAVFARYGPYEPIEPYSSKLAIAGLVCTLLYILSQWREIGQSFAGRQARYGSLAAASVFVVLGILGAINYLSTKYNKRWDLTAARQFSLSDQTKKVLQDLKQPVKIRVFARSEDFQRFRDRLDEYTYQSKLVTAEYIDPEKKPGMAEQLGVTSLGTVVFEYAGRNEKVTGEGEQELTNGLIKVIQGRQPKIYFTQGHGEKDTTAADRGGYNAVSGSLTSENFVVEKLVLAQVTEVPADADLVIIAGPRTDFLPAEVDLLKAYLARGGKLFVMLDPVLKPGQPDAAQLQALLKDWGIDTPNDLVLDVSSTRQLIGLGESVPVAANYPPHTITQGFNLLTAYPVARSISPIEGGVNGRNPQKLIETGPRSWAETDIKALSSGGPAKMDGSDKAGPISLGVAVSGPATNAPQPKEPPKPGETPKQVEARIVAIGDSDFPSNAALGIQGNRDLFLNVVNWLAQQENLISIRAKDPEDRRITLTAKQEQVIFYLTVLIVPGLILLAGVQTWWRRR